jgi:hypothetical protein
VPARGRRALFELPLGAQPRVVETGPGAAVRQQLAVIRHLSTRSSSGIRIRVPAQLLALLIHVQA